MGCFERAGNHSVPETGRESGFVATGISIVSDTRVDLVGRRLVNYV